MSQILDEKSYKTSDNVKILTPTEFEEEWNKLFPAFSEDELPVLIRVQAD